LGGPPEPADVLHLRHVPWLAPELADEGIEPLQPLRDLNPVAYTSAPRST
jgi:hypothetical protein